jgi:hypothetical protein
MDFIFHRGLFTFQKRMSIFTCGICEIFRGPEWLVVRVESFRNNFSGADHLASQFLFNTK